jgi:hypothetical protein
MSQISHSDWNPLVSTIQTILGGWGQSYSSYAVATGNTVNHADWNALVSDINKCYTHITGSNSSLSTVATGTRITQANLTNASAAVTYINSNQYSIASSQYTQNTLYNSGSVGWSGWTSAYTAGFTVDWGSAANYNHFFNAGGVIFLSFSSTGTNAWSQEISNVANYAGTIAMSANSSYQTGQTWSGSFGPNGALNLSGGNLNQWIRVNDPDTNYTADNLQIQITPNGSYNNASSWQVNVIFTNGRTTIGGAPNTINGTIQMIASQRYPYSSSISSFTSQGSTQI